MYIFLLLVVFCANPPTGCNIRQRCFPHSESDTAQVTLDHRDAVHKADHAIGQQWPRTRCWTTVHPHEVQREILVMQLSC